MGEVKMNLVSLLYYYGFLTITDVDGSDMVLSIPNKSVHWVYNEYIIKEARRSIDVLV